MQQQKIISISMSLLEFCVKENIFIDCQDQCKIAACKRVLWKTLDVQSLIISESSCFNVFIKSYEVV